MARAHRAVAAMAAAWGGAILAVVTAVPAGADVVDPPGACTATGTWQDEGVTRSSGDFEPDDLIVIPQRDTVLWSGSMAGFEPGTEGPRREISGEVAVDIAGLGSVNVDDWGGDSVKYANDGQHDYDVPDVLLNVKMRLHGEHREAPEGSGAFTTVCSGSVYLQVEGGTFSNPLSMAALAAMVISGGGLVAAGVVRPR